jgi:hypothetical protein
VKGSYRAAGSKVGRLPRELRETVNQWIGEATPAAEIVARLQGAGRSEISAANIESWRESGYLDHLEQVERLNQIRLRSEASVEMVKAISRQGKVPITEANDILVASLIYQALESFDPEMLKEALMESPKRFFNLASAVSGQAGERARRERLELELEKFRQEAEARRAKLEASLKDAARHGGITAETLEKIQEQLKLL